MSHLGIITGLASETDCLDGIADPAWCRIRCAGASGSRAGELARELAGQGCSALLSFGLAGGLDPLLPAGHLVLVERVMAEGRTFSSDASWLGRCEAALAGEMPLTVGTLLGVTAPVVTGEEKRRLYEATGAAALDMESHAVAAAAEDLGVPFLGIRVIADTASLSIPHWLSTVIDGRGAVKLTAFFGGLLTHPGDGADVVRLAAANRRAMVSLRRVAAFFAAGLGFL